MHVVRNSAPAQMAVRSIPHWDMDLGEKAAQNTFLFHMSIGTVIDNDTGAWDLAM